jgi:transcriptional regulator GlxA family with amidase domain
MSQSTGRPGEDADRVVVVALYDKVTLLDVAAPLEVFARANDFGARYRVLLMSADGKPVQTTAFTGLSADLSLAVVPDRIDTLLVPGGVPADFAFSSTTHDVPEEVTPDEVPDALMTVRELVPRAARIASVCTGAFVLARLGLLNGRRATTHWAHCARLARDYPDVMVEPDALFVEDGPFITGAGISAGTDLAVAIVEDDYGTDLARRVARWLVMFLQRPGGQAQFGVWNETSSPATPALRKILDSVVLDPAANHSIAAMAARASMSERHLTRTFREEVGMTPARYVEQARLEAAKLLLVTSEDSQECIARRAGFGTAETMRRIFHRNIGVSPGIYRKRFGTTGIERSSPASGLPVRAFP